MLQQILSDMYIDPELLEELPEEQKQFLFFKMREEQVRRWMIREKELEKEEDSKTNGTGPIVDKKSVNFMKGEDGNDWVWVMGEHENDRSIEQILEEEAEEKALKLAELQIQKEIAEEKERLEKKRLAKEKEDALRNEREREEEKKKLEAERIEEKMRQEEKEKELIRKEEELEKSRKEEEEEKEKLKKEAEERDRELKEEEKARDRKALEEEANMKTRKLSSADNLSGKETQNTKSEDKNPEPDTTKVKRRPPRKSSENPEDDRLRKLIMRRSREILFDFRSIRARFEESARKDGKELKRQWRAQELKSKAAEEEIKQASLRVRQVHERSIRSPINALMAIQLLQAQPSTSPEEDAPPEPAPRKLKPRPLPIIPPENDERTRSPSDPSSKPPVPPRPRVTRRPVNRQAAANWFHRHQKPRGAVIDPLTHRIAPWFHGAITRQQAEAVLEECPQGTFLLRLSERLFGYAVSVRGEHRCKHFLVEAMPQGGYRLFGLGQHPIHRSLHDFVLYHKTNPLSVFGREILKEPVSQTALTRKEGAEADSSASFIELFPEIASENLVTAF